MSRAAILLSLLAGSCADIFKIEKQAVLAQPELLRQIAMFTPAESPASGPPGNGQSYMQLDLTVSTANGAVTTGFVEIVIVKQALEDLSFFGHRDAQGTLEGYCCTYEYIDMGLCSQPGTIIVNGDDIEVDRMRVEFKDSKTATLRGEAGHYDFQQSGLHTLVAISCLPEVGAITFSGSSTWMNPYGYLDAQMFFFLPFYGAMALVYLLLSGVWLLLSCCNWKDVVAIQHSISIVLALTTMEMVVQFFDYLNINSLGVRHPVVITAAIILSSLRRTVSRMLLLSVSMGWGVVKPSLGSSGWKIGLAGCLYLICESVLELVIRWGQASDGAENSWRLLLILPVGLLNAFFYVWTFTTLFRTQAMLKERNQDVKLRMFRMLERVLLCSLLLTLLALLLKIFFVDQHRRVVYWSQRWLMDGGLEVILYTVILAAIAFIWKPSVSSRRYAYAQVGNAYADHEDETEMTMAGGADHSEFGGPTFVLGCDDDDVEEGSDENAQTEFVPGL